MAAGELTVVPFARAGVGLADQQRSRRLRPAATSFANTGKEVLAVTNASGPRGERHHRDHRRGRRAGRREPGRLGAPTPRPRSSARSRRAIYNDDDDNVNVSYSLETDLTVAAFSLTAGV
jgi:hypothetical protein